MADRFDLEQALLAMWSTKEDIDLLLERYLDSPVPMTEDEVSNFLIGLAAIHDARSQRAFHIFERLIAERKIT